MGLQLCHSPGLCWRIDLVAWQAGPHIQGCSCQALWSSVQEMVQTMGWMFAWGDCLCRGFLKGSPAKNCQSLLSFQPSTCWRIAGNIHGLHHGTAWLVDSSRSLADGLVMFRCPQHFRQPQGHDYAWILENSIHIQFSSLGVRVWALRWAMARLMGPERLSTCTTSLVTHSELSHCPLMASSPLDNVPALSIFAFT